MRFPIIAIGAASLIALTGCVDDYGYGGVSVGYGGPAYYGGYYDDFYDGGWGVPYYGWYSGYYYPGSGYYVYDRDRRPHRWNDAQRNYWESRGHAWRGNGQRHDEWRGFDRGPWRGGGDGWQNRGQGWHNDYRGNARPQSQSNGNGGYRGHQRRH